MNGFDFAICQVPDCDACGDTVDTGLSAIRIYGGADLCLHVMGGAAVLTVRLLYSYWNRTVITGARVHSETGVLEAEHHQQNQGKRCFSPNLYAVAPCTAGLHWEIIGHEQRFRVNPCLISMGSLQQWAPERLLLDMLPEWTMESCTAQCREQFFIKVDL